MGSQWQRKEASEELGRQTLPAAQVPGHILSLEPSAGSGPWLLGQDRPGYTPAESTAHPTASFSRCHGPRLLTDKPKQKNAVSLQLCRSWERSRAWALALGGQVAQTPSHDIRTAHSFAPTKLVSCFPGGPRQALRREKPGLEGPFRSRGRDGAGGYGSSRCCHQSLSGWLLGASGVLAVLGNSGVLAVLPASCVTLAVT